MAPGEKRPARDWATNGPLPQLGKQTRFGPRRSEICWSLPTPELAGEKPEPENGKLVARPVCGDIQHDYRLVA